MRMWTRGDALKTLRPVFMAAAGTALLVDGWVDQHPGAWEAGVFIGMICFVWIGTTVSDLKALLHHWTRP